MKTLSYSLGLLIFFSSQNSCNQLSDPRCSFALVFGRQDLLTNHLGNNFLYSINIRIERKLDLVRAGGSSRSFAATNTRASTLHLQVQAAPNGLSILYDLDGAHLVRAAMRMSWRSPRGRGLCRSSCFNCQQHSLTSNRRDRLEDMAGQWRCRRQDVGANVICLVVDIDRCQGELSCGYSARVRGDWDWGRSLNSRWYNA